MTPLTQWPIDQRRDIAGVLTDIDDTLTRDGAIEPAALEALERLLGGEFDQAERVRVDRPMGLWRHRLPEAFARLLSPLL